MLSARDIIEGSFYAMEQAGLLIDDAAALYAQGKWPSSLVLAVFALEELGKAEILLQRGIDAATTGPKPRDQVIAGGTAHRTKLKAGQGAATVTASVSFWEDIPAPNTAESAALEAQLDAAQQIALDNAPAAAHAARMRALYVDLGVDEVWAKPKETGASDAYLMVSAASIQYGVRREKFVHPISPAVTLAVQELGAMLPILPEPPDIHWPNG
jgi:AbiV family abortive infection protein